MKTIIFSITLGLLATNATLGQQTIVGSTASVSFASKPPVTWSESSFNFGKIKMGTPVTHEFNFVNNSETPLVITSVQASCGCTVTEYTKDPVPQGGRGYVKATYNAAKEGVFSKSVTVNTNLNQEPLKLMILGEVVK